MLSNSGIAKTKVCLVCGDKSIGRNFGALTCESCKAFFRRNAHKLKEYECHFKGECRINLSTRRFCRTCRLKKCFIIGMKEEWILNDTERETRRNKIKTKRQKRLQNVKNNINSETNKAIIECNTNVLDIDKIFDTNSQNDIINSDILHLNGSLSYTNDESNISIFENTSCVDLIISNSNSNYDQITEDLQLSDRNFTDIDISNIITKDNDNECNQQIIAINKFISYTNNSFNEIETKKLNELLSATNHMQRQFIPVSVSETTDFRKAIDFLKFIAESHIKKLIKMCKNLNSFKLLCERDQLSLIKFGAIEMIKLRGIFYYDFIHEYYAINELTVIILFNPNRYNLKHREFVSLEHKIYIQLLERYLQIKYQSKSEAKRRLTLLVKTFKPIKEICNFEAKRIVTKWIHGYRNYPLLYEVCNQSFN
ncbi:vitamin D3 receptor-like [Oppia nitens]|uniref:vitamin D3 receptor-like n=1 Tax=Oppia nitens TaxID=1686743 RepID=UPI0023DB47B0|nr:vitamin D3 receptor-like [Oppia nitens]